MKTMRMALDIGGTAIKCAIVADDGKIIREGKFRTDSTLDSGTFGRLIVEGVRDFLSGGDEQITSIGAGMAGFTDAKKGIIYQSPNIPGIRDFNLVKVLEDEFDVEAYVDNDATVAAWGEFLFGGHNVDDLLVVTLGTGIGGGLVLGGRLHRGEHGFTGEIGQMVLHPDGDECRGGGAGCLELYTGRKAVIEKYCRLSGADEKISPREIYESAADGDSAALETWSDYGRDLGILMASVGNLLDLGAIVVTGGLSGAYNFFYPELKRTLRKYLISPLKDTL
ncbi:MAG TPA: ROK family protein, partial [bacterium]